MQLSSMEAFEQHREAARDAARHLQRLWLPPKHARLLQEPPPANCNTPLLTKLMQQSTQHAQATAAALNFCLRQLLAAQLAQQQEEQQQQQQLDLSRILLWDVLSGPQSPASQIVALLVWLHKKPDLAADLVTSDVTDVTAGGASRSRHLQEMWLAGMQVWQSLSLLAAASGGEGFCLQVVTLAHDGKDASLSATAVQLLRRQLHALASPQSSSSSSSSSSMSAMYLPTAVLLECLAAMHTAAGFKASPEPRIRGTVTTPNLQQRKHLVSYLIDPAADLVVQLQRCAALLPPAPDNAAAAAAAAAGDQLVEIVSGSASVNGVLLPCATGAGVLPQSEPPARLALGVVRMQQCLMRVAGEELDEGNPAFATTAFATMMGGDRIGEAGLQLLCAYAHILHEQWTQARHTHSSQQQQQQLPPRAMQAGCSNSSSSSRRPVQFGRLGICAVHQRLKLLPASGGQLYLQAVRAVLQQYQLAGLCYNIITSVQEAARGLLNNLKIAVAGARLQGVLKEKVAAASAAAASGTAAAAADQQVVSMEAGVTRLKLHAGHESSSPAVTAAAVLLVIEVLQLLAALHEHQAEQQQEIAAALDQCQDLLLQQTGTLVACASAGYSVRRSVVLRQAGQQLLQLLRWQVQRKAQQHAHSSSSSSSSAAGAADASQGSSLEVDLSFASRPLLWAAGAWDPLSGDAGDAAGLLPSLATAYPVDYFSLVDTVLQSGLPAFHSMSARVLLRAGFEAFAQQPAALLQQPKAVASVASAVASIVKAWSLYAKGEVVHGMDGCVDSNRRALAALPKLLSELLGLAQAVKQPYEAAAICGGGGSSSSSSTSAAGSGSSSSAGLTQQRQQLVNHTLIAVLLARSVVVLTDAIDAAAAQAEQSAVQCLAKAVCEQPMFNMPAKCGEVAMAPIKYAGLPDRAGSEHEIDTDSTAAAQFWQLWQVCVVALTSQVLSVLLRNKMGESTAGSSGSGSSSSSTTGRVQWEYLLPAQLKRSKKLSHAANAFGVLLDEQASRFLARAQTEGGNTADVSCASAADLLAALQDPQEALFLCHEYSAALHFCRVLAAAAPLPQLCNNLHCSSLAAGGTEAAAAVKVCSACGAWYCSAGCAAAHWRQHKKACRRLAAFGLNVNA